KNGYGEYLVYRSRPDGTKKAISEEEYQKIFDVIEKCRALKGDQIPNDRHAYLKGKIQEVLGNDVQLAFVPRTLYSLIYLQQCIQEEIDLQSCANAKEMLLVWALGDANAAMGEVRQRKVKAIKDAKSEGFWQLCFYHDEDYLTGFPQKGELDYR